jgi:hypothetical protein
MNLTYFVTKKLNQGEKAFDTGLKSVLWRLRQEVHECQASTHEILSQKVKYISKIKSGRKG